MVQTKVVQHVGFTDPVTINAEDFDPAIHAELDADAEPAKPKGKVKKGES